MNINQFHKKYRKITESPAGAEYTRQMVPYVVCKDGFTLSVQASYTHYCSPREVGADFYDEFEKHNHNFDKIIFIKSKKKLRIKRFKSKNGDKKFMQETGLVVNGRDVQTKRK